MTEKFIESVYKDADGEGILHRWPQLLASFATGKATETLVHWYIREFHAFVDAAPRRVDIFHDWGKVTSFTHDARRVFLKWGADRNDINRRVCRGVHILVESTLIFLALEAARSFSGGYFTTYRERQAFELERDRRMRSPSTEEIRRS